MPKIDHPSHSWDVTTFEARRIQEELREQVITEDQLDEVRFIAGVDVGFEDNFKTARAAAAVLTFPELELHESFIAREPTRFPYVPGLLSFREIPVILAALAGLKHQPDLVLCDGQGLAHPRRFGVACHLGVLTGLPTIGVGKSRYIGEHDEPSPEKGSWTNLIDKEEVIGAVLRTRDKVNPLYVSIGHKVSLDTAIRMTLAACTKYRQPETTRWADNLASTREGKPKPGKLA